MRACQNSGAGQNLCYCSEKRAHLNYKAPINCGRRTLPDEASPEIAKPAEKGRLDEARDNEVPWKQWGPYLSERQWGTVLEDYSENGDAWNYFSHDQARSRAYHWGEDGLAGISDDHQRLCFALAFWNGKDPILKERLFGLTNSEGNHGEDVKEYYFYLDSTFHAGNGAGIRASHQTGWTGIVALLIEIFGKLDQQAVLAEGRASSFGRGIETA
jgi:hypothetical protein